MHQLEKEAQNDPFLMEALEGYEGSGIAQEGNLADIRTRLEDRIGKKEKRIIPWRVISIAASILIVLGIGGLWLINDHTAKKPQTIARINKTNPAAPVRKSTQLLYSELNASKPVKKKPEYASLHRHKKTAATTTVSPVAADAASLGYNDALADISPTADKVLKKPTIDISNEVVVVGYGTRKRTDVTGSISSINPSQITNKDLSQAKVANTATGLEGKVSGLKVNLSGGISGTVVSKEDGLPLPGVTVKIKGTSIATQTNTNGEFSIDSVSKGATLELQFIGYDPQYLAINSNKVNVTMAPSGKQLGEVVVTGALGIKKQSRSLGYATATISSKELNQTAVTNNALTVKGVVTSKEDGLPIPGVIVKVKGTNIAVTTNSNGEFAIGSVPKGAALQFSFIGYENQVVYTKGSNLNVAMNASSKSLGEVVVTTAFGAKKDDDSGNSPSLPDDARPANGWYNYHKYLKQNSKSPDGKKGVVKLSFIVNSNNSLSDFKIIRSVSAKTDSTAIELVKNGPRWYRNTDGGPQTMKLRIKFNDK
jgi:hypothetical protein